MGIATAAAGTPAEPPCSTSSNDTCSHRASYQSASALLTTNLLHNHVKVAAKDGDIGVVGAEGGLANRQGRS
jgi:hypothetical protein